MIHDKISFTREYCKCRRIPYRIVNEQLYIDKKFICYSLYNLTYEDIIKVIDNAVQYEMVTQFYMNVKGAQL